MITHANKRCAIYTRKSSEEGLDQAFNSLDAQRQAAVDYIRSQKHEGWTVLTDTFDDGAFSGGNMERPALQRLLGQIRQGKVDVVVVYKVDRLSRSLGDFAQMMKVFDEHQVSFVSVTQQFNTTNSMGRLTLNMLLSFAQFEREVTGERIRDKIAATKKKGMWVGGQPPLGYRLDDRKLIVVPEEAERINTIFEGRLEHDGSLLALSKHLNTAGYTTKRWTSRNGVAHGGRPLTPTYLHKVLTNQLYRGKIVHKKQVWVGQHEPIIDNDLWDQVHTAMASHKKQRRQRWQHPHLLKGKLFTSGGDAMSPTSTHRPRPRKTSNSTAGAAEATKRVVRYYVSQKALREGFDACPIKSLNAQHLDHLVRGLVANHLGIQLEEESARKAVLATDAQTRDSVRRVTVALDELTIDLGKEQLNTATNKQPRVTAAPSCAYRPSVEQLDNGARVRLPISIRNLDGRRRVLTSEGHDLIRQFEAEPQTHIVSAIGRAYRWRQLLRREPGLTVKDLARRLKISDSQIRKYLPLINLSPTILRNALGGTLPSSVSLQRLIEAGRMMDWGKQAAYLNLPA